MALASNTLGTRLYCVYVDQ